MILKIIALALNYINFLKNYKRGVTSSIFFIMKNVLIMILFNFVFEFLIFEFRIDGFDFKFLFCVFIVSLIFYFTNRKYSCITFGLFISYFIFKIFRIPYNLRGGIFLIGVLHIFEGIFILFFKENKVFISLPLGEIDFLFMIFYGRKFYWEMFKYGRVISGILIFNYGIIVLAITTFKNNFLSVVFICVLHEFIYFLERRIFKKLGFI